MRASWVAEASTATLVHRSSDEASATVATRRAFSVDSSPLSHAARSAGSSDTAAPVAARAPVDRDD